MTAFKYTTILLAMTLAAVADAQTQQIQREQPATGQPQIGASRDQVARQAGQAGRQGVPGQGSDMNTLIASCMLIGNQEEIALAQLAVDRAESDQVKQFAQKLIDDHQRTVQKLQPLAKPGFGLNESAQTASAARSSAAEQPTGQQPGAQQYTANRPNLERGAGGPVTVDQILQLNQQAAQECLQMTKSMLEEKQGAEFDKAFSGMQVGAHVGMLAKLKASEQHATGELASLIQESQQTVQNHLEQAEQICKQLESGSTARQARNQ